MKQKPTRMPCRPERRLHCRQDECRSEGHHVRPTHLCIHLTWHTMSNTILTAQDGQCPANTHLLVHTT
jgi:hypothetical protein